MATISFSKTISAAHLTRVITAAKAKYGMPDATNAQVQAAWEQEVWAGLVGMVKVYEQQQAAKAAADAITDIALT